MQSSRASGRVGGGSGNRTESGLGDIVLGATYAAY